MKDIIFKGCGTAICTPFDEKGEVNYDVFEKFIEFQIENKVDSIIVCGTTGESATMSVDEKKEVIEFVVKKVNKRIPVIAGTGSNNTIEAVNMTKYAEMIIDPKTVKYHIQKALYLAKKLNNGEDTILKFL